MHAKLEQLAFLGWEPIIIERLPTVEAAVFNFLPISDTINKQANKIRSYLRYQFRHLQVLTSGIAFSFAPHKQSKKSPFHGCDCWEHFPNQRKLGCLCSNAIFKNFLKGMERDERNNIPSALRGNLRSTRYISLPRQRNRVPSRGLLMSTNLFFYC
jgi:hypothetical protein